MTINLLPGEVVQARLLEGAEDSIGETQVLALFQYNEGFHAEMRDEAFADFRPAFWQKGWQDAHELAELAPAVALRL
jgi:hypothetical protein